MVEEKEYLQSGLEVFHVPNGLDTVIEVVVPFTVYTDGSISTPTDLNQAQTAALVAYITWGNEHTRVRRGNSLSIMPEEKQDLLDIFIDSMKSPAQKFYETLHAHVLADCATWLETNQHAHVSYCEEMYDTWQDSYRQDGTIPATGCTVFELNVGCQYGDDNTRYRYHYITLTVEYHVSYYHKTKTFQILQCRCGIIENRDYVEYLND